MIVHWGVPDWQDANAYGGENLTDNQWWWEFTRRRPDYRSAWERAEPAQSEEMIDSGGEIYRFADDVDRFRLTFQLSTIHNPTRPMSQDQAVGNRFRTNYGVSPRNYLAEQSNHPHISLALQEAAKRGKLEDASGLYRYNFDLSKPLTTQIETCKQLLEAIQNENEGHLLKKRPRKQNWTEFLRTIDARDAGATFSDVATTLWPQLIDKTPQSARDTHRAACELRDNFPL